MHEHGRLTLPISSTPSITLPLVLLNGAFRANLVYTTYSLLSYIFPNFLFLIISACCCDCVPPFSAGGISPCSLMLGLLYINRLSKVNTRYVKSMSSRDLFLVSMVSQYVCLCIWEKRLGGVLFTVCACGLLGSNAGCDPTVTTILFYFFIFLGSLCIICI